MGRRRPQAARHRRARRVRHRAEDRRARRQPRRTRTASSSAARRAATACRARTSRRTSARSEPSRCRMRGRRAPPAVARGAGRGLPAALRLPRAERAAGRDEPEARAEPAQRRRRLGAAEELGDHRRPPALRLDLRRRPARTASTSTAQCEMLEWLRERGFRTNPYAERLESVEDVAEACRGLGDAAGRARLRDRRDRDQGRLARPAATARRAPRPAALGARVQVGADDARRRSC